VYPRHHEPVLWLAANQFVLSLTWILLALILYVRHLRTGKIVHYALTYLCVVLALASNEVDSVGSALKSWSTTL